MPQEQSIVFRQPATANLLLDSADRDGNNYASPFDFQITKTNALMNGFFNRIATAEVVLEWCEPNITGDASRKNNVIVFDLSGEGANTYSGQQIITLAEGSYTVKEALDQIVDDLNDLSGTTGITFNVANTNGETVLNSTNGWFQVNLAVQQAVGSRLAEQLDLITGFAQEKQIRCPDIRPYRYIDFISQQLTYNQELKDATTNTIVRDVLCRWYFADDEPDALDGYDFPILMGYKPFVRRRLFNPPKQIRWSNNQSAGNLAFQVYGWSVADGLSLYPIASLGQENTNWMMTLQVSEN